MSPLYSMVDRPVPPSSLMGQHQSQSRKRRLRADADDESRVPPDFIDRREAEKRAGKLIAAIGKDHAALVVGTLQLGFSPGCWRILSALEAQAGSVPLITPELPLVSLLSINCLANHGLRRAVRD